MEIVELVARVLHVAAALLWLGLIASLTLILPHAKPADGSEPRPPLGPAPWARLTACARWSSLVTVLLGVVLLFVVYYGSRTAYLTGAVPEAGAWMNGLLGLTVAVALHELLARSAAGRAGWIAAILLAAGVAVGSERWLGFTPRASYVHAGALLGAIMATNTWMALPPEGSPRANSGRLLQALRLTLAVLTLMLGAGQPGLFSFRVAPTILVLGALSAGAAELLRLVIRVMSAPPSSERQP